MDNNLLYINTLTDGNRSWAMHSHPSWEVVYFTAGNGWVETETEKYPFSPGTVVCIPPNMVHGDIADGAYQNIHLNMLSFVINSNQVRTFQDAPSRHLQQLLELTFRIYIQKDPQWQTLVQSLFGCIKQYIALSLSEEPDDTHPQVQIITQLILENLSNPQFQVSTVFEDLPFSPDYLRRLFKKKHGCTPQAFLVSNRVDLAKRLLFESSHISQVAQMAGFSDVYYFSRVFKEHTGRSPSRWLNDHRSKRSK